MRRSLSASLGLALVLACAYGITEPSIAEETEKSFERDLGKCRSAMERERWRSAAKAYRKLFEDHANQTWVLSKVSEIEAELRECLFRESYALPDAAGLFGDAGRAYAAKTRRVKLAYQVARGSTDWVARGKTMLSCRHPFMGDVLVEVRRDGTNYAIYVCWDPKTASGYVLNAENGRMWRYDDSDATFLGEASTLPSRRDYRIGFRRVGAKLEALRNGSPMMIIDRDEYQSKRFLDRSYDRGYVMINAPHDVSVSIVGTLPMEHHAKLLDEHRRASYATWIETEWKRDLEIPEWARGKRLPTADLVVLPKGAEFEGALLRSIVATWLDGDDAGCRALGSKLADAKLKETPATLFAQALVALADGAPKRAFRLAGEAIAGDPDFGPAYAVRGLAACRLRRNPAGDVQAARSRCGDDIAWPEFVAAESLIYRRDLERAVERMRPAKKTGARGPRFERRLESAVAAFEGPGWAEATRLESETIRVESDATPESLRGRVTHTRNALIRARRWFNRLGRTGGAPRARFFTDHEAFARFAKRFGRDGAGRIVIHLEEVRELIVWAGAPVEDFARDVREECAVWALHERVDSPPRWFERGHALLASLDDPDAEFPLAARPEERKALRQALGSLTSIDVLTTLAPDAFSASAERHEAESLALVHLLRSTKDAKLRFLANAYFDGLTEGRSAADLYVDFFAPIRESLQTALEEHARRLTREK